MPVSSPDFLQRMSNVPGCVNVCQVLEEPCVQNHLDLVPFKSFFQLCHSCLFSFDNLGFSRKLITMFSN